MPTLFVRNPKALLPSDMPTWLPIRRVKELLTKDIVTAFSFSWLCHLSFDCFKWFWACNGVKFTRTFSFPTTIKNEQNIHVFSQNVLVNVLT